MESYIVLDLGGSSIKFALTQNNEIIFTGKVIHQNNGISHLYEAIFTAIDRCIEKSHNYPKGIVMGSPGYINTDIGKVIGCTPNLLEWEQAEPKKVIFRKYNIPVHIENDANLMVFGEASSFHFKKNVLGYTIGTGIGTGFIQKDAIFYGSTFSGLEAGHIIIDPNGRDCCCGKTGCIEAYASAASMLKIFIEKFPDKKFSNIKDVLDQSQQDPCLKSELENIIKLFAIAISNIVSVLNPEVILIGGGVSEIESYPFELLKSLTLSYIPEAQKVNLIFEKAKFGNKAALIGGLEIAKKLWSNKC